MFAASNGYDLRRRDCTHTKLLAIREALSVGESKISQNSHNWQFVARRLFVLLHDAIAAVLAWIGAFWLRFNLTVPDDVMTHMIYVGVWVVPIQTAVFWGFGLYRGIWRYASLHDLKTDPWCSRRLLVFAYRSSIVLIPYSGADPSLRSSNRSDTSFIVYGR